MNCARSPASGAGKGKKAKPTAGIKDEAAEGGEDAEKAVPMEEGAGEEEGEAKGEEAAVAAPPEAAEAEAVPNGKVEGRRKRDEDVNVNHVASPTSSVTQSAAELVKRKRGASDAGVSFQGKPKKALVLQGTQAQDVQPPPTPGRKAEVAAAVRAQVSPRAAVSAHKAGRGKLPSLLSDGGEAIRAGVTRLAALLEGHMTFRARCELRLTTSSRRRAPGREGAASSHQQRRALLRDLTMARLLREGALREGAVLVLPPRDGKTGEAEAPVGEGAAEPQTATINGFGQVVLGEQVYESVEAMLEAQRGLRVNKKEREGWSHVVYRAAAGSGGGAAGDRSLAEHVHECIAQRELEVAMQRVAMTEALACLNRRELDPEELEELRAREQKAREVAAAKEEKRRARLEEAAAAQRARLEEEAAAAALAKAASPFKKQGKDKKAPLDKTGEKRKREEGKASPAKAKASPGRSKKKPATVVAEEEEFLDNPFLAFWKSVQPDLFQEAMEEYALWGKDTFQHFDKNSGEMGAEEAKEGGESARPVRKSAR